MGEMKYCSYCGQELEEGSTFCVYCQLDSKDFKYDIQEKDYFEVKLRSKITLQARAIAIYSFAFAFLTVSGFVNYIVSLWLTLVLDLCLVVLGILLLINVKKDNFEEKTFIIITLIIYLIFVLLSVIFLFTTFLLTYFMPYLILLIVVGVLGIKYLRNVSKYRKKYLK